MTGLGNPLRLGAVGVALVAVLLAAAIALPRVAFLARTNGFTAQFSNAAGLAGDAQVMVAGVPAGRVTAVRLAGDHVEVDFRLDAGQSLDDRAILAIKLQTVLGRRYLAVQPGGGAPLPGGAVVPVARTSVPYDIGALSRDADASVGGLDTAALKQMMRTLTDVTPDDPQLVGQALDGVTAVSRMLAEREDGLRNLLRGTKAAADMVVAQESDIAALLDDGSLVAQFLADRRDVIHELLVDVNTLTTSVRQFLDDTDGQLDPLLVRLENVAAMLAANEKSLTAMLDTLAPTVRYVANATGNGPWADVSGPAFVLPDNVLCVVGLAQGCR
ncbi:MCE family protein [Pseudonocardia sp. CA-107938]|uniref:MCE family protein n=1 Tax=Pseudonocardia sp. CA-107938 TaxID=3240021 RepID=UPI003D8C6E5A